MIPLSVGGKRESHMEQDQVNREVVPIWQCSSHPKTAEYSRHCEQVCCREAVTICSAIHLVCSCTLNEAYTAGSSCKLADWWSGLELTVDDTSFFEECDHHDWHYTVLLSSISATSKISTDYSGLWFPSCTLKFIPYHQWWLYEASQIQFKNAQWCLDTLACGVLSDHDSAILTPFLSKSLVIIFHWPFSYSADLQSFEQPTNDCHTSLTLPIQH